MNLKMSFSHLQTTKMVAFVIGVCCKWVFPVADTIHTDKLCNAHRIFQHYSKPFSYHCTVNAQDGNIKRPKVIHVYIVFSYELIAD